MELSIEGGQQLVSTQYELYALATSIDIRSGLGLETFAITELYTCLATRIFP